MQRGSGEIAGVDCLRGAVREGGQAGPQPSMPSNDDGVMVHAWFSRRLNHQTWSRTNCVVVGSAGGAVVFLRVFRGGIERYGAKVVEE